MSSQELRERIPARRVVESISAPVQNRGFRSRLSPAISVLIFLLFGALSVAGYFYYQYKHAPSVMGQEEIENLVAKIGKVMEVPTGEVPTLATVTNKEKLDNQPFFKRAENGDKILIYSGSGRAILYRPNTGKIIDVTTVNIAKEPGDTPLTEETPVVALTPEPEVVVPPEETTPEALTPAISGLATESATVALYNGTNTAGMTNDVETKITNAFPVLSVEKKGKASRKNYPQTVVIDLSGSHTAAVADIAKALGGAVEGALPTGEINPGTDILVIVGGK